MKQRETAEWLPRSADGAVAAAVLIQAMVGLEFLLGGLNKLFVADYHATFRDFVSSAPGAQRGVLAQLVHSLVLPHFAIMSELARLTELGAGAVLLVTAAESTRRWFNASPGYRTERAIALLTAAAAATLGGLSLTIYLLQGGAVPAINPALAFGPPIAIELFNVPLALGIAALQFGRFLGLKSVSIRAAMPIGAA
jgi:hypothetical protein